MAPVLLVLNSGFWGDVGALRLDILNAGETLHMTNSLDGPSNAGIDAYSGRTMSFMAVEGGTLNKFRKPRSKNAPFKQFSKRLQQRDEGEATCPSVASPDFNHGQSNEERKLMHIAYPKPMISFATNIQTSHLIFLMVWFAFVQMSISLVHKSILLLELCISAGNEVAEGQVMRSNRVDPAGWHLCLTHPNDNEGYPFDSESTQGFKPASKTSLEEAWHAAEQYLNEAIENDCQGAYFSYNCTTPQQGVPESALGRWNRDNAGRLRRQLWP